MKIKYLIILLILIFECGLYSQDDPVDTTEYQTDEIIITGTRTEQKIIDIPYPVTRINSTNWITSRKVGVQDVLLTVPGLFLQPRYGNHDTRITIRGYGSRSNTGIRGIRILLDGIPESEPDGQTRIEAIDFDAIGRIEVVRGYSSSLYANAPGGVINFLTDKYFPVSFFQLNNEFGSYGLRKNGFKLGVNTKNSRFMTSYSYQNYDGYRQHSQEYQHRLNTLFEADINPESKLSVYGYYVKGLIKLPGSLTLQEYNANDTMARPNSLTRDEKRISEKGRLGVTLVNSIKKGNMKHIFEVTGYGTIKIFDRTARTYRIFTRYGLGGTLRYVNKYTFGSKIKSKQRTNEFTIGTDLFYQDGPVREYSNVGGQKGDDLQGISDETLSNIGIYALNQFDIVPQKLTLLLSGRYDKVVFAPKDEIASYRDTTRVFSALTPKAALNFKLMPHISLYTSFGLGFDSPAGNEMDNYGFTSDSNYHSLNPDLLAQKSTSFEVGIKGESKGIKGKYFMNTFFEISFYHIKIEDAIVPFIFNDDAYFRNAAEVKRTGIEVGFNTEFFKGLSFKSSFAYQNFKYDKYVAGVVDINGLTTKDYSGNIEPSNPKIFFTGELMYQHTFSKKYTFYVKSTMQHVGEMFVNDANMDSLKTASYTLLNAQVGIDLNFDKFRLIAYGGLNNIADKKYVAFININSDSNRDYFEAGPRRNFFGGLTLAYLFK